MNNSKTESTPNAFLVTVVQVVKNVGPVGLAMIVVVATALGKYTMSLF